MELYYISGGEISAEVRGVGPCRLQVRDSSDQAPGIGGDKTERRQCVD